MIAARSSRLIPLALALSAAGLLAAAPGASAGAKDFGNGVTGADITANSAIRWTRADKTASAGAKGFEYGVTAAEVTTNSAILWARADKTGTALIQIGKLGGCDLEGAPASRKATVSTGNDKTVQKKISGLKPGTTYRYRFCMKGGAQSSTGTFTTPPAPNQAKTIRFALSGDQDAMPTTGQSKPYWNNFQVWNRIKAEHNNFNVLLGDTIYSDTEVPGKQGVAGTAITVPQKWEKYRLNLGQEPWVNARGATAYYAHWDDHEFINDFSPFESVFPESDGNVNIDGKTLYETSLKAFRNYNPTGYSKKYGIYRSFRWGKNLEVFFLDERSFRSQSADYNGTCDNPAGSGTADLAPTAPQSTRSVFGLLIPALTNPPPPDCVTKINDPNRTMLGQAQLSKFENAIRSSKATFKVIMNEVPIQQYYALPYDRWEGYAAERTKLLTFLKDRVKNVVFLTTDVHANLVNDARLRTLEPGGPVDSGTLDIVTGPIATKTYAHEINDTIGAPYAGLIRLLFFKPAPPRGVGMQCAGMDQFSYAEVTVSKKTLRVQLKDINGKTAQDTADGNTPGDPCGPYTINAR